MSYSYNYNLLGYQGQPISYGASQVDPAQVAGYALATDNAVIKDESKATDGIAAMSVFSLGSGAYKLSKYAKNSGTTVTNLLKEGVQTAKADATTLTKIIKSQDETALAKYMAKNNLGQEIFNLKASLPTAKKMAKMTTETKSLYEQASKALTKASKAKTAVTQEKYINQAKAILENVSGKASTAAKTATTAAKTVETAAKTATTASKAASVGSKALKFIKGNALFLAIEGGVEVVTNVIPTFQKLGAKSGMKQVGKSAVKVGASVGGFAAGAAAGAAIGSIIPGAGTAVGAVIGGAISMIGGLFASNVASKAAKAIVGKDELELAEEKEQEQNIVYSQSSQQTTQSTSSGVSNQQLMQQLGLVSNPTTTTTQINNPYSVNPLMASYTTQDNSNNLLLMPLRTGLQFTA